MVIGIWCNLIQCAALKVQVALEWESCVVCTIHMSNCHSLKKQPVYFSACPLIFFKWWIWAQSPLPSRREKVRKQVTAPLNDYSLAYFEGRTPRRDSHWDSSCISSKAELGRSRLKGRAKCHSLPCNCFSILCSHMPSPSFFPARLK